MQIAVVLTAGGLSTRLGMGIKKEFFTFPDGKTVLSTCAESFLTYFHTASNCNLSSLVITLPKHALSEGEKVFYTGETGSLCKSLGITPSFIEGGASRQESVKNALYSINSKDSSCSAVLIHDAARPYVGTALIQRVIDGINAHGACVPVIQSTDTQKRLDPETGFILDHLDRKSIVCVQTPQGFLFPEIFQAHQKAALSAKIYTDDSEIWSDFFTNKPQIAKVLTCEGETANKKITFSSDLSM
ncbi:MAG TPA: IspD/TarI family cytidylyltransferase [Treponemataceae bacterium]|nr:IspD/TarI family cytidylyltransferase [Treponemataceae bacterium]